MTVLGGVLTYAVPVAWFVLCISCISAFLGTDTFTSSTSIKPYPNVPYADEYSLPRLTCIAPKGCYVSPVRTYVPHIERDPALLIDIACR